MIAVVGPLSWDVVDGRPRRPGGPVYYAARALASIGAEARLGASCSRADRPELAAALESFGLPVNWHESERTTAYRFRYTPTGRRLMSQDAIGDPWTPSAALAAVGDASWVHVGALVRTDFPPDTLAALAGAHRRMLMDGQGLVRTPRLGPLRMDRRVGDVLRHAAILKLDEDEAAVLLGGNDAERIRSLNVPEVILTLGARGSLVVTQEAFEAVEAVAAPQPLDPTGAGDMFGAIYLAARARDAEPVEAAREASEHVARLLVPA